MSDFKGRHFEGEIVLWAVRCYCRYGVSYRDLEQMMGERGVSVDHSTIYRWVQSYAPEIEKRLRWQWRGPRSTSWRIDETYVKVRGKWTYLYRAVDKHGNTIDFYLSPTRNTAAAKRFLSKTLHGLKDWEKSKGDCHGNRAGDRSGGGRDWRHEAATRSVLPPSLPGRAHQPCCVAVSRVQPQPA